MRIGSRVQYGDDEAKKQVALDAARKVKAADLKRAALQARAQEATLATQVNAMAALTLLQEDILERINPAIVERYLERLDDTGLVRVQHTAAGDGVLLVSGDEPLPSGLGGKKEVLVATSGEALRALATSVDIANVLPLGPGDRAFSDLVGLANEAFAADLYEFGAAEDATSITGYDLYAFEGVLSEAEGRRSTAWAALVRVDATGRAGPVRWESLANLVPTLQTGSRPHPARQEAAADAAQELASRSQEEQQKVRSEWFAQARKDLTNLPLDLTVNIPDHDARVALRNRLKGQTATRLAELEGLSHVNVSRPRLVARLQVLPAATPPTAEEKDSETIAMVHVQRLLESEGWRVADVHADNRGYDIHAVRGRDQRLIEVKGVWASAASTGVRLTGGEILMATQHRHDYWLYVVDRCNDGVGTLFGSYADPAVVFQAEITGDAIFRVSGSSLSRARRPGGIVE